MPNIYDVIEQDITLTGTFADPFNDVAISVIITRPNSTTFTIGGFFHSVVGGNSLFKFRYMPKVSGTWNWSATKTISGVTTSAAVPGTHSIGNTPTRKGHVKRHPTDNFSWITDSGSPFYPIGIGESNSPNAQNTDIYFGTDLNDGTTNTGEYVLSNEYFSRYGDGKFNTYRFGLNNNTFSLITALSSTGVTYSEVNGRLGDLMLQTVRAHNMSVIMVLFASQFVSIDTSPEARANIKKYIEYCINRYSAYVDFWEVDNEATDGIGNEFLNDCIDHIELKDPYGHAISNSFIYGGSGVPNTSLRGLPKEKWTSPHAYVSSTPSTADTDLLPALTTKAQSFNKPIILTEVGRYTENYTPTSDLSARIWAWSLFFNKAGVVFWQQSVTTTYSNPSSVSNLYVGFVLRGYIDKFTDYTEGFPAATKSTPATNDAANLGAYALSSPTVYGAYIVNRANYSTPTTGKTITVNPTFAGTATWTNPATGAVLATQAVNSGSQTINVPSFTADIALKIVSDGSAPPPPPPPPPATEIKIDCGRLTGGVINGYSQDAYFNSGSTYIETVTVDQSGLTETLDNSVLQSYRFTPNGEAFSYVIPTNAAAAHTIRMWFWSASPAGVIFNISINGVLRQTAFNPYVAAGNAVQKAVQLDFSATPINGQITVEFTGNGGVPVVMAMKVMPDSGSVPTAPVASFTKSASSGFAPLMVNFTDTSTNKPTSRLWNFGTGQGTSGAQNPSKTFTTPGTYQVTLTATNAGGSSTSAAQTIIVTDPTPPPPNAVSASIRWKLQNRYLQRGFADDDAVSFSAAGSKAVPVKYWGNVSLTDSRYSIVSRHAIAGTDGKFTLKVRRPVGVGAEINIGLSTSPIAVTYSNQFIYRLQVGQSASYLYDASNAEVASNVYTNETQEFGWERLPGNQLKITRNGTTLYTFSNVTASPLFLHIYVEYPFPVTVQGGVLDANVTGTTATEPTARTAPTIAATPGHKRNHIAISSFGNGNGVSIYRSTVSGVFDYNAPIITEWRYKHFEDKTAANGTAYYYVARATYDGLAESVSSSQTSATPQANLLPAISAEVAHLLGVSVVKPIGDEPTGNTDIEIAERNFSRYQELQVLNWGLTSPLIHQRIPQAAIAGTVSLTNGSFEIIGNGTAFLTQYQPDSFIEVAASNGTRHLARVYFVESDMKLTVWSFNSLAGYTGTTESGRTHRPGTDYLDSPSSPDNNYRRYVNYYDLALSLYNAYYRTGSEMLRLVARQAADIWVEYHEYLKVNNLNDYPNEYLSSPRQILMIGVAIRAHDGKPEYFANTIKPVVDQLAATWLLPRIAPNPHNFYEVREFAHIIMMAAAVGAAYLNTNGTTNSTIRSDYVTKSVTWLKNYFHVQQAKYSDKVPRAEKFQFSGYTYFHVHQPFIDALYGETAAACFRLLPDGNADKATIKSYFLAWVDASLQSYNFDDRTSTGGYKLNHPAYICYYSWASGEDPSLPTPAAGYTAPYDLEWGLRNDTIYPKRVGVTEPIPVFSLQEGHPRVYNAITIAQFGAAYWMTGDTKYITGTNAGNLRLESLYEGADWSGGLDNLDDKGAIINEAFRRGSNYLANRDVIAPLTTTPPPPSPPVAAFTRSPASGNAPLSVSVANTSTGGTATTHDWNWGDGTAHSSAQNPAAHSYPAAGVYTITLTETNAGGSSQAQASVTVNTPTTVIRIVRTWEGTGDEG